MLARNVGPILQEMSNRNRAANLQLAYFWLQQNKIDTLKFVLHVDVRLIVFVRERAK